jgi:hypothetical protein
VNGAGCAIEYAARAKHRAGRKAEGDSDNETVRPETALYRSCGGRADTVVEYALRQERKSAINYHHGTIDLRNKSSAQTN